MTLVWKKLRNWLIITSNSAGRKFPKNTFLKRTFSAKTKMKP